MASIALHKQMRRQVPQVGNWGSIAWQWQEMEPHRRATSKQWWWIGLGGVALTVIVSLALHTTLARPTAAVLDEMVLEVTPPTPQAMPEPASPAPVTTQPESSPSEVAQTKSVEPEAPVLGIPESPSSQGSVSVPTGNTLLTASTSETPNGVDKAAGDGPLSLGSVPGSASAVIPIYPARAEAEGREGTVVALVTTDTLGRVVDWKIEKSAGREFDESVRRAVLSTRYQVPVRDGRPQAVVFRLPYRFRLE